MISKKIKNKFFFSVLAIGLNLNFQIFPMQNNPEPYLFKAMDFQNHDFNFSEFNRLVTEEEPAMLLTHNQDGLSPLHLFVETKNLSAITKLFQVTFKYFEENLPDSANFIAEILNDKDDTKGWTPLHLAAYLTCENCDDQNTYRMTTALIKHPLTDVNVISSLGNQTPLDIINDFLGDIKNDGKGNTLFIRCLQGQLIGKGAKTAEQITSQLTIN